MAATQAQIRANRRNARKSTGPQTEAGKARSRRNAWQHGLAAETLCMLDESTDAYRAYAADLRDDLSPAGAYEEELVDQVIRAAWRKRRCVELETEVLEVFRLTRAGSHPGEPLVGRHLGVSFTWATKTGADRSLELLNRYAARLDREFHRTVQVFEKRQRQRRAVERLAAVREFDESGRYCGPQTLNESGFDKGPSSPRAAARGSSTQCVAETGTHLQCVAETETHSQCSQCVEETGTHARSDATHGQQPVGLNEEGVGNAFPCGICADSLQDVHPAYTVADRDRHAAFAAGDHGTFDATVALARFNANRGTDAEARHSGPRTVINDLEVPAYVPADTYWPPLVRPHLDGHESAGEAASFGNSTFNAPRRTSLHDPDRTPAPTAENSPATDAPQPGTTSVAG